MNPIIFTAMVTQGERSGKMLIGYPVEVAKYIGASEFHSDERECVLNRFSESTRIEMHPDTKVS
ncbi:hypothetical protein [Paenibacillus oleatilyticus]|uniref:Uncharacterized protein n=1 Tax=Paenibacillus oleatilyticus TaxID=2594886 RepID=A0ABV4VCC8_9BACL